MLAWFARHKPLYQTLTDYCPHGVWQCPDNPASAETFRAALYGRPDGGPAPAPDASGSPSPEPGPPSAGPDRPETLPTQEAPAPSETAVPLPDRPGPRAPWFERCFVVGDFCIRFDKGLRWWTSRYRPGDE